MWDRYVDDGDQHSQTAAYGRCGSQVCETRRTGGKEGIAGRGGRRKPPPHAPRLPSESRTCDRAGRSKSSSIRSRSALSSGKVSFVMANVQGTTTPAPWPPRLKALRRQTGMTQAELAACVGVGRQTVCGWETGRREPSPLAQAVLSELATAVASQENSRRGSPRSLLRRLQIPWRGGRS